MLYHLQRALLNLILARLYNQFFPVWTVLIEPGYTLVRYLYGPLLVGSSVHCTYIHREDKWMASSPHERITHARSLKNGTVPKR